MKLRLTRSYPERGSPRAAYYYFDDKEDLFATAVESALDGMLGRLPLTPFEDLTAEEFWPAVERSVGQWASMHESSKDLLRATLYVTEARRRSPRFAAMLAKAHGVWRTLIEGGQRLGCKIRRPLVVEALSSWSRLVPRKRKRRA
jgi:AcrR family transcriptional regulator